MSRLLTRVYHSLFKEKFVYDNIFNLYELIARALYFDLIESQSDEIDNILTASEYNFHLAISQDMNQYMFMSDEPATRCRPKLEPPPCNTSKLPNDRKRISIGHLSCPILADDSDGHVYEINLQFEDGNTINYEKKFIHYGYQQPIGVYTLTSEVPKSYIEQNVLLTIKDSFKDYPQIDPVVYRYTFRLTEISWTEESAPQKQRAPAKNK